jgi:hypothetical protein
MVRSQDRQPADRTAADVLRAATRRRWWPPRAQAAQRENALRAGFSLEYDSRLKVLILPVQLTRLRGVRHRSPELTDAASSTLRAMEAVDDLCAIASDTG